MVENWSGVERMQLSTTWLAKRDEIGSEIIRIVQSMGREDAMAAIDEIVADSIKETVGAAVDGAIDAAAQTDISIGGEAVELRRVSEMAAKDAVFTTLGYLNWFLIKDGAKRTHFEENPFEPMMGLWKLGLWPMGIARYGTIHFWIGVPPSAQGVLPVIK